MTRKDLFEVARPLLEKHCRLLLETKGADYAHADDIFDNFKRGGVQAGIKPEQAWLLMFLKHVDSIATACRVSPWGRSEPIWSRIADARNYLDLLYGYLLDFEGCTAEQWEKREVTRK